MGQIITSYNAFLQNLVGRQENKAIWSTYLGVLKVMIDDSA